MTDKLDTENLLKLCEAAPEDFRSARYDIHIGGDLYIARFYDAARSEVPKLCREIAIEKRTVELLAASLKKTMPSIPGYKVASVDQIIEGHRAQAEREIGEKQCEHNWVSAKNSVVISGEVCTKCHVIRAEREIEKGGDDE